jgi:hypothetical protein
MASGKGEADVKRSRQMARQCNAKGLAQIEVLVVILVGVFILSLLPVACRRTKSHASPANIDSKNLKQTVVVATLDCPLPEHKNAIWCATFQMAWDRFKQDVIGEPIQVRGAEELANRLNAAPFPAGSIEGESYYAAAGFVKKGIIEEIQSQMKQRFPSEPVPTFDSRYTTFPDVVLAYAYLSVDVRFEHPYYIHESGFGFRDSNGVRTDVAAFCVQATGRSQAPRPVRPQVEVLYYESLALSGTKYFAVDLSRQTHPYQVILACLPRPDTLGEATKMLQNKMAASRNDPNYQLQQQLEPEDTLIVPDVLYKLTHHFDELLGKFLGNQKWTDYFFFEALQKIDFTLSRTGVVLRSEGRVGATKAASPREPRHLHFDRPFLICVQKREPNATPFFLMWVDNAELMKPYGSER